MLVFGNTKGDEASCAAVLLHGLLVAWLRGGGVVWGSGFCSAHGRRRATGCSGGGVLLFLFDQEDPGEKADEGNADDGTDDGAGDPGFGFLLFIAVVDGRGSWGG